LLAAIGYLPSGKGLRNMNGDFGSAFVCVPHMTAINRTEATATPPQGVANIVSSSNCI
jgi:hypothetical protein